MKNVYCSWTECEVSSRSLVTEGEPSGITDADDLEGYLSPAEDTTSILSDDYAASLKPYVQVQLFFETSYRVPPEKQWLIQVSWTITPYFTF